MKEKKPGEDQPSEKGQEFASKLADWLFDHYPIPQVNVLAIGRLFDAATAELQTANDNLFKVSRKQRKKLKAARVALDRVVRACREELELPYYRKTNPPAVVGTFCALQQIAEGALK